ncbi:aggrecan core protein-like [Anneissia japonica]|uniref:aggrecan core protein-like n=1 Tax=Anneissia japonica TaxID=1529436 RepID=UPI001425585D|nr:aggrecan core protein-like [Anneissia japonica]
MFFSAALFFLVLYLGESISLVNTGQYVIVPLHVLQGWSQETKNYNHIQCLLACSRQTSCFSVNYNRQGKICQMNNQIREIAADGHFLSNSSYDYMEKVINKEFQKDGVYFLSVFHDYQEAEKICRIRSGSIASYEQLYNAFQPSLKNCKEGWLISGEIAFTEITGQCTLKPPEQRSNVFPCKIYQSGVYCYRDYNESVDIFDYLPKTQRIIRLTDSNSKKLNAEDAEICCSTDFGGHLAMPVEVYTTSLSLGVNLCEAGWLSNWLAGNPCYGHMPPDFWLFPIGNLIRFKSPTNEYNAFCFVPLSKQNITYTDPFPSHRVASVEMGYTLNYYDARDFCKSRGGRMATRAEVEYAQQSGYDCCSAGWVTSGEVVYPVAKARGGCANYTVSVITWGYQNKATFLASSFCYME